MIDYHIHPEYSIDAKGSVHDYCNEALERGIGELCFTTHLDLDPRRDDCYVRVTEKTVRSNSSVWFEDYESTIRRAADEFIEKNLVVRMGVEVDLYPGVVEDLPEAFHSTDFDLIIGSIHLLDHLAISVKEESQRFFTKHSLEDLAERYYGLLLEMLDTGFFNILGHLDIYRRYGEEYYGAKIHRIWEPHIKDLVKKMKHHDVGFEINTSSWRQGLSEPMPETLLIDQLVKRGIENVTVGSDSHNPTTLGAGIQRAYEILHKVGLQEITTYLHKKPTRKRMAT